MKKNIFILIILIFSVSLWAKKQNVPYIFAEMKKTYSKIFTEIKNGVKEKCYILQYHSGGISIAPTLIGSSYKNKVRGISGRKITTILDSGNKTTTADEFTLSIKIDKEIMKKGLKESDIKKPGLIVNGFYLSKKDYKEDVRAKTIKVFYNDKACCFLVLKDNSQAQYFNLPIKTDLKSDTHKYKFKIIETYGEKKGKTAPLFVSPLEDCKANKALSNKCGKNYKEFKDIITKKGITYLKKTNKKFTGCVTSTINDYDGNEYATEYKNGLKDGFEFFEGDDLEQAGAMKTTCSLNKKGKTINSFESCYIDNRKPGYQKTGYTS
jgi:hypothetical protein